MTNEGPLVFTVGRRLREVRTSPLDAPWAARRGVRPRHWDKPVHLREPSRRLPRGHRRHPVNSPTVRSRPLGALAAHPLRDPVRSDRGHASRPSPGARRPAHGDAGRNDLRWVLLRRIPVEHALVRNGAGLHHRPPVGSLPPPHGLPARPSPGLDRCRETSRRRMMSAKPHLGERGSTLGQAPATGRDL